MIIPLGTHVHLQLAQLTHGNCDVYLFVCVCLCVCVNWDYVYFQNLEFGEWPVPTSAERTYRKSELCRVFTEDCVSPLAEGSLVSVLLWETATDQWLQ